jgi:predicted phosphodiesterase
MRIAIFSDIHGNTIALDAVLADVALQGGADTHWIVGDFAALGPDPVGALERVNELPNALFVRGNTDRYVCNQLDLREIGNWIRKSPEASEQIVERQAMLTWTQGALVASGWMNWLAALSLEQRPSLPDGTRVLLVHASPGTDDGDGIRPNMSDESVAEQLGESNADLVIVGHTHWQLDRTIDGVRVVNLGSVSNPLAPDLRASYYWLEADERGYRLENRRVEYDRAAVIAQLQHIRHPGTAALAAHMRGERKAPWM